MPDADSLATHGKHPVNPVPVIAPAAAFFLVFEFVQLVVAERLIGVKKIKENTDPRLGGPPEPIAAIWTITLVTYWLWQGMMLVPEFARMHAVILIVVSLIGFALRRNVTLKWVLVVMTFEGAIRIGILIALLGRIARRQWF